MRLERLALLLASSLALAGCTFPGLHEASAAPRIAPPPPGCEHLVLDISPSTPHPGQQVVIHGNLTNVCSQPIQIQSRNGCETNGLDLSIVQGDKAWHYRGPDAAQDRACSASPSNPVTLQPGTGVNATWTWDGTFTDAGCGRGCSAHAAPEGSYAVQIDFMGRALTSVPLLITE